jgi:quercetin dioxygenase-like cupin family protein
MSVQQHARLRHQEEIPGRVVDAGVLQWLVDRQLGAQHLMTYRLSMNTGSTAPHAHSAEEVLYVLEGSGAIRGDDDLTPVIPGQAIFLPEGANHAYVNDGDRPLVVVGTIAPPIDPATIESGKTGRQPNRRPIRLDEEHVAATMMGERRFRVLVDPATGCQRMTQFTGIIPTGRAPLHSHPHEEVVYILAGTGRLWIEDVSAGQLRPGSVVFIPVGTRHTLENTGEEAMKLLGTFSPAGSPAAKLDR